MDTKSNHLIIIAGPTAVGKTEIAISLAQEFKTSIVSCDSRQLYKEMNIGTAKPSSSELSKVPHHFINHLSINDAYSAGKYENEAIAQLDTLHQTNPVIILTGGTGLYLNAIVNGIDVYPDIDPLILEQLDNRLELNGLEDLLQELKTFDPEYYQEVDKNNSRRIIRALSVIKQSCKTFTSFRSGRSKTRNFTPIHILLQRERAELYDRINHRVDKMIEEGLEKEALSLYPQKGLKSLQTVGYQEFFEFFDGNISKTRALELIKQNSRRYAKRQMTWYRKQEHWKTFHPSKYPEILSYLKSVLSIV